MGKARTNQFASYGADGEIVALVAEGLPDWPDDITTLSDDDLGAMHEAYVEEATRMAADTEHFDATRVRELTERIPALRSEAQRRFAEADVPDPDYDPALEPLLGLSEAELAEVVAYAEAIAAEEAEPEDTSSERAALAALARDNGNGATGEALLTQVRLIDPGETAAATARGISEGVALGLAPVITAMRDAAHALTERAAIPAQPRRPLSAGELGGYNRDRQPIPEAPASRGTLRHTGDVPGVPNGAEVTDMAMLVDMFMKRRRDLGYVGEGVEAEKVVVATYKNDDPTERRDLRGIEGPELKRRIDAVCGPKAPGIDPFTGREAPIGKGGIIVEDPGALVASGGLAAPVEPYYPQLLLAEADRPVMGALPGFTAERGGIRLVLPASLGTLTSAVQPGHFTDGTGAGGTTGMTSATANFTQSDVGSAIVETDALGKIPAGTIITTVTNATTIVLSQATTAGAFSTVAFNIANRNPYNLGGPVGVVTAAQDAAGPPSVLKYTYDVPLGTQAEHDVYSVYTSIQFGNLTARTFPEQVELNIGLANALAARVADTQALNYITGWSTMLTFAKTFGTARQLLAQWEHLAAYYRNFNRMDPTAVLRLGVPAWVLNAMRGDYVSTFIGGEGWQLSDDELQGWFADRHILPFFYWDGPSDLSQLFAGVGAGAINTGGVNNATPVAVPDYPGTGVAAAFRTAVVSFLWAEGTWLGLTTGELNLGLVRDSILNSQNKFRNFEEVWETPAFVGLQSLRCVHTVAADGSYGAAATVTLGAGNGL